jgi:two-component system, OmpR family, response regulator
LDKLAPNSNLKLSPVSKSVRIHIIEGNHNLRSLLAWHLHEAGYQVQQSPTLAHAYQLVDRGASALTILDSDLPDGEGIEFCQWLYPQGNSLVLMLSARIRESDAIAALQAGVDDYLKKPFGMPEFMARVAALMRRNRFSTVIPAELTYGDLRIDLVRRRMFIRDRSIDLSPQEFSLIYILAQANGQPVHRQDLLERAWGEGIDNPRTVDSHVLSLRKKLGKPNPIATVRKIGYRLNY